MQEVRGSNPRATIPPRLSGAVPCWALRAQRPTSHDLLRSRPSRGSRREGAGDQGHRGDLSTGAVAEVEVAWDGATAPLAALRERLDSTRSVPCDTRWDTVASQLMETQISLRLPRALLADIDVRAQKEGTSRSRVIRGLLERSLRGQVAEASAPYDRVRDLVGSVDGDTGRTAGNRRASLIQVLRDHRG